MVVNHQERRPRGRGGGSGGGGERGKLPAGAPSKSTPKFPKAPTQRSFHAQSTQQKRGYQKAEEDQYLAPPPQGLHIVSAKLVLPRDDLFPRALEDPKSLDDLRLRYKIWITFEKPHVLTIYGQTPAKLQEALAAIHWFIHDMRLTNEQDIARFVVQERSASPDNRPVRVLVGRRPCVVGETTGITKLVDEQKVPDTLWEDLGADLSTKAESLMGLGKDLHMRVNFGRLNVRRKEKGNPDEFTHQQFRKLLEPYGRRGNASLGKSMPDSQIAYAVLESLTDPLHGLEFDATGIRSSHTLTLVTEAGDVNAAVNPSLNTQSSVSSIQAVIPEDWSRLDWTVAAPDMPFDWNLEVKATEKLKSVPSDLQDFIQRLLIQHPESNAIGDKLILPRPSGKDIKPPSTKVVNTRMRSSATVTLNDGQYIVEVNVTRTWDQVDFNKPPTATWGIELYGTRWEEAINTVGSNGRKKDWGKDLIEVWPGSGFGFEDRFKNFLRCVLKVKAFLDRVALNANEQLKPRD